VTSAIVGPGGSETSFFAKSCGEKFGSDSNL
jgi:hypothetical protein